MNAPFPVQPAGADAADTEALALYVHWPFCVSKCPYCDFNSHVRASVDQQEWREAMLVDLAFEARAAARRPIGSIFFGGGTPSLMPPQTVAALIDAAANHWGLTEGVEITLEANPSSVEAARFADLALAGVNRLSLGLQSLDDAQLRFLGRAHDADEGLRALAIAQECFDRVSFDLIYALPGQTENEWAKEIGRAIGFGTSHLSLYQLTIEPGTRFATLAARGELTLPDADEGAALFALTQAATAAAGLPAYEISNHARPGAESRHNLAYWRYQTYVGVGPGAHGRRGGRALLRHRKPENWLRAVVETGSGIALADPIPRGEQALEALLMGLRLREGVDLGRLESIAGVARTRVVNVEAIERLTRSGLVARDRDRLRLTPDGRPLLDAILTEIAIVPAPTS